MGDDRRFFFKGDHKLDIEIWLLYNKDKELKLFWETTKFNE